MNKKSLYARLASLFAATLLHGAAVADQHTTQALEQAKEAAGSVGDSKAVSQHATEALKHIEAAKAEAANPGVAKHLEKSEAELQSAVKNANRFNADTAVEDAKDAQTHLDEAIHKK